MSVIENIRKLSIDEIKEFYGSLFDTYKEYFPDATDETLATMVSIATGVCPYCYDSPTGCHCWNDE